MTNKTAKPAQAIISSMGGDIMENTGVKCDVCECVYNTDGCGCNKTVIEVTHDCSCTNEKVQNPHFCKSYEMK